MTKIILHVDLDCFFAAVEARDNPKYMGKPLIIGADPKGGNGRGVISTCSYEARKYGLHSAMPISKAYKLCPHGIYIHGNYKKYSETSQHVMNILKNYSEIFVQTSIDEAYLDITENCENYKEAKIICDNIREEIKNIIGITCSVGCGPTKTIAKIASDFNKPNGTTIVEPDCIKLFLKDMPIQKIPGIGKVSKKYYNKNGCYTINDFYKLGRRRLFEKFDKNGIWIWNIINGIGNGIVFKNSKRKSIGAERTFMKDTADIELILNKLKEINHKLHVDMKEHHIFYKTLTLKIRFTGFDTYTRAKSFQIPFCNEEKSLSTIYELFNGFRKNNKKIRLVGVRFSGLDKQKRGNTIQMNLTKFLISV